ncbi:MAG: TetR/AcrR family transcriptional regulator; helix-turn-helix transcriptional regulator, partial [Clostridiales bacterium]|nr:TetR/AcrR family transcriptional regulator; helix-turn-helix transcriptional regulator [Clostridiales bacterium]
LEVSRELFLKKGYCETKIIDISKAAGISPATIYLYFSGKKELFDSLDIPEVEDLHPQFEKKRAEIIRAALIMFGEKGFDGTSMDAIAKQIGYSKATLYQYFENKEELFSAVMKETPFHFNFTSLHPQIEEYDLTAAVREIGMCYMSLWDTPERVAFTRMIISDSKKHPKISNIYHKNGIGYVTRCLTDCLEKYDAQIRKDIDLYLAAKTYVSSLFAFAVQYKVVVGVDCRYTNEEFIKLLTDIFVRGIQI